MRKIGRAAGCLSERAGAMLEFAVIFPVLSALIFGIIQYGFIFAARMAMQHTVSAGARFAILDDSAANLVQIKAFVMQSMPDFLNSACPVTAADNSSNTVDLDGNTATTNDIVIRVQLDCSLPLFFPFVVPGNVGGSLPLSVSAIIQ